VLHAAEAEAGPLSAVAGAHEVPPPAPDLTAVVGPTGEAAPAAPGHAAAPAAPAPVVPAPRGGQPVAVAAAPLPAPGQASVGEDPPGARLAVAPGQPASRAHAPGSAARAPEPAGEAASEMPGPQMADLITSFLPSSHEVLDEAIERFLEPLDELGGVLPEVQPSLGLIPTSLAVAASFLALDLALRVRRPKGKEIPLDRDAVLFSFPGLPGPRRWSPR
jgi:hypothetical protein